jgi:hypothetical protein
MPNRRLLGRLAALTLGMLVLSCGGERSVLVGPLPGDDNVVFGVVPGPSRAKVRPVARESQLGTAVSWSFDAGPEGVAVQHPFTGLSISIPRGALSVPTRITVTALRGSAVAYRFEPHGLLFAAPVQLTQSLNGIKTTRDIFGFARLIGGYFPDDSLEVDEATGLAGVVELLPVWLDYKGKSVRLEIRHFSGYTVASASHESGGSE